MRTPAANRRVATIPSTLPATAIDRSVGSPPRVSISRTVVLPMIHAGMPVRHPNPTKERMPKTRATTAFGLRTGIGRRVPKRVALDRDAVTAGGAPHSTLRLGPRAQCADSADRPLERRAALRIVHPIPPGDVAGDEIVDQRAGGAFLGEVPKGVQNLLYRWRGSDRLDHDVFSIDQKQ